MNGGILSIMFHTSEISKSKRNTLYVLKKGLHELCEFYDSSKYRKIPLKALIKICNLQQPGGSFRKIISDNLKLSLFKKFGKLRPKKLTLFWPHDDSRSR